MCHCCAFCASTLLHSLAVIDADLQRLGAEIAELLSAIVKPGEVQA